MDRSDHFTISLYIYIHVGTLAHLKRPLPSILIAVCVPMSSHCDFYGMCAQHRVAFVGGNQVIFLLRLVVNAFFLCRTDLQIHAKSFKKLSQTGAGVFPGGP